MKQLMITAIALISFNAVAANNLQDIRCYVEDFSASNNSSERYIKMEHYKSGVIHQRYTEFKGYKVAVSMKEGTSNLIYQIKNDQVGLNISSKQLIDKKIREIPGVHVEFNGDFFQVNCAFKL